MGHSTIYCLNLVADSKNGDYPKEEVPVVDCSAEELDFSMFERFADSLHDEDESKWENELMHLAAHIREEGEERSVYKNIDGHWYIKMKVSTFVARLAYQYSYIERMLNDLTYEDMADYRIRHKIKNAIQDEFGIYILDVTEQEDGNNGDLQPLDEWVAQQYCVLIHNFKLTNIDEVIFRVENILDYHY